MDKDRACAHCPGGIGLKHPLFEDGMFHVVCDVHPLVKGHILLIPGSHISCMGALSDDMFLRFSELYHLIADFIGTNYGRYAAFEHGVAGQTVFHAHMHFLPFSGSLDDIVPERDASETLASLDGLRKKFSSDGNYLYLDIDHEMRLIETSIAYPRFFRERFSRALGAEARADWRIAGKDRGLMRIFSQEMKDVEKRWKAFGLNG